MFCICVFVEMMNAALPFSELCRLTRITHDNSIELTSLIPSLFAGIFPKEPILSNSTLFAIGTYTDVKGHAPFASGEGIKIISLSEEDGSFREIEVLRDLKNPSYLDWDPRAGYLYAITENEDGHGQIQAYSLSEEKRFQKRSSVTGPAVAGCHLAGNYPENTIYATSYMNGTLRAYELKNGDPGKSLFSLNFQGNGPNMDRQISSHAHQVMILRQSPFFYVCDLGSDKIWMGRQSEEPPRIGCALTVPEGYGPRHLAFDPNGEYAYILCELIPRILVVKIDQSAGFMEIFEDLPTVVSSLHSISAPAAVKVHPSGHSLAVSNRFDDSITIFHIIRERGKVSLEFHSNFSSQGKTPRDITFSPGGAWLLIANQDSSDVQFKSFKKESGLPAPGWAKPLNMGTPVCIVALN